MQAEREQILAEVTAAATKAAFAEGKLPGTADEAAAIKAGKVAGANAAAEVLAPLLGVPPQDVLKNNAGLLEKGIRSSMGTLDGTPSSPAELAASSEQAAIAAAEKAETEAKEKAAAVKEVQEQAGKDVKEKIEEALQKAKAAGVSDPNKVAEDSVVNGAQEAAAEQIEGLAEEGQLDAGDETGSEGGVSGNLASVEKEVTSSIADEAVQAIIKAATGANAAEQEERETAEARQEQAALKQAEQEAATKLAQEKLEQAQEGEQEKAEGQGQEATLDDAISSAQETNPVNQAGQSVAAASAESRR